MDWSKVNKHGKPCPGRGRCWEWTGGISGNGYGYYKSKRVHRLVYELLVGPIPAGKVLDHLCQNKLCVRPTHLEPVSDRTNLLRSNKTQASINIAKTHCINGHPFDKVNTFYERGCRQCLTCRRIRDREGQRRRRALRRLCS